MLTILLKNFALNYPTQINLYKFIYHSNMNQFTNSSNN